MTCLVINKIIRVTRAFLLGIERSFNLVKLTHLTKKNSASIFKYLYILQQGIYFGDDCRYDSVSILRLALDLGGGMGVAGPGPGPGGGAVFLPPPRGWYRKGSTQHACTSGRSSWLWVRHFSTKSLASLDTTGLLGKSTRVVCTEISIGGHRCHLLCHGVCGSKKNVGYSLTGISAGTCRFRMVSCHTEAGRK